MLFLFFPFGNYSLRKYVHYAGAMRRWDNDFVFPRSTRRSMVMHKTRYVNMYTTRAYKTAKIINIVVPGVDRRGLRWQTSRLFTNKNDRVRRAHKYPSCCTCIIASVTLRGHDTPIPRSSCTCHRYRSHITRVYRRIIIYR